MVTVGARLGTIAGCLRVGMDVLQDEVSPDIQYWIPLESVDSVSYWFCFCSSFITIIFKEY